ncbi:MAG: signal peptidase [Alphaproteobacteria bacterium]|nr:signal peptidase [Alphaproteobacteria bacterium]
MLSSALLRRWARTVLELVCFLAIITAAKSAIAEPYYVSSGSMEPTLLIGDEMLAMKYPYGYGSASLPAPIVVPNTERIFAALPSRGDVVVFRWPGDRSQIWVKRAIGLPGDRIAMRAGRLWINGTPVAIRPDGTGKTEGEDGSVVRAARFIETLPGGREHPIFKLTTNGPYDNMAEVIVPAGQLFVMGDNRDNSADSRVPVTSGGVGILDVRNLVGRADVLVASWDFGFKRQPVWTWPSGLRLSRFFTAVN